MVQRWEFEDLEESESWVVPLNPREMTSPFASKNITSRATTAIDGRPVMFEGTAPPHEWQFSGAALNSAHYAELKRWVAKRHPIRITDHLGRRFEVYLTQFEAVPQEGGKRTVSSSVATEAFWKHEYTIHAQVINVIDPAGVG